MTPPEQQIQAVVARSQAVPGLGAGGVQRADFYAKEHQQRAVLLPGSPQ